MTVTKKKVRWLAVGGLASVAIITVAAAATAANDPADDQSAAAQVAPNSLTAVHADAEIGSLSDSTVRDLGSRGVIITPAAQDADTAKISPVEATKLVASTYGFVNDGGKVTHVQLSTVTNTQYGKELEKNLEKPSQVDPIIEDRLAWVVEFEGFRPFISGPLGAKHDSAEDAKIVAHLIGVVDPATGDVLFAQQF